MKPNKPSSKERVEHILKAIEKIDSFTKNTTMKVFFMNDAAYFACLFQFAIIGEAVVNIDDEILRRYSYPWHKVKSFRNFILHEYHAIDERVVWDTAKIILPDLEKLMQKMLVEAFD